MECQAPIVQEYQVTHNPWTMISAATSGTSVDTATLTRVALSRWHR